MRHRLVVLITVFTAFLTGCGGGGGSDTKTPITETQPKKFTISATSSAGGSVYPESISIEENKTTTFTLTADENYIIESVTGCDGSLSNDVYTIGAANRNCSLVASFSYVNQSPTVNAGDDQAVEEVDTVTLQGVASDIDGVIANYSWQQTSGTEVTLNSPNESTTTFSIPTILASETLMFSLTVTDDLGLQTIDEVSINVNHTNIAPTVNAGEDQAVEEVDTVTLQGVASDIDGVIANYSWQQTSGTEVTLNSPNESTTTFSIPTILASETLMFSLTVTDDLGLQTIDEVSINVNHTNIAPTLALGEDISVSEKSVVTLTSTTSDVDGEIAQYQWQQITGDILTITDYNASTLTLTIPDLVEEKIASFQLTITDDLGAIATDTIVVTMINDSQAPNNVTLVSLTASSENGFTIDWLETNDNLSLSSNIKYTVHVSEEIGFTPSAITNQLELTGRASAELSGFTAATTYYAVVSAEDEDNNVSYSNQMSVTTMANPVVVNSTQVVHEVTTVATTDTQLTYTLSADEEQPQIGEIIFSSDENGVLRKITAVSVNGEQVTVDTESASLNEVYDELDVNTSIKLIDVPESESISANNLKMMKSAGLSLKKSISVSGKNINELKWNNSGLTLSQEARSSKGGTTQISKASANTVKTATSTPSTGSHQEIKDEHLIMKGPLRVSFMPGKRGTFTVSASVINDAQDNYSVSDLEFVEISHNKVKPLNSNYGATIVETTAGTDNNKRDITLYWTTKESHVDTESAQPYIATFKAKVRERDCSYINCNKGSALISVKLYVGNTEIPKLNSVSFAKTGDITINGNAAFKFEPKIDVGAKISLGSLDNAHAVVTGYLDFDADLQVLATASGEVNGSKQFIKKSFVKVLAVGGAPVIIRGEFILTGEFNANATGELDLTNHLNVGFDFSAGFKYVNGQWVGVKESTPSLSYKLTGSAKAEAYAELRLVPELKLYFYEFASGHVKVEPYIYAEAGIEGEFVGLAALETGVDISTDYRFTKLNAGIGMDLKLRAGFEIFDKSIAGWPDKNLDSFNTYKVLNKTPLFGLPEITLIETDVVDAINSCVMGVQAKVKAINLPFTEDKTLNNWEENSGYWAIFPSADTDSIVMQKDGFIYDAQALLTTYSEYRLRFSGYSELGSWANQYQDFPLDFRDENNDLLPDYWATKYQVSSAHADTDNDGISNLEEFDACTFPNNVDSDNDGMPDGWEVNNGLLPTVDDANEDADNDGRSNLAEFFDGTNPSVEDENPPPTVSAGSAQSVDEQTTVTLSGGATDAGGRIASVLWQQTSGVSVTLNSIDSLEATFMAPTVSEVETLIFTLTATDNSGAQAEDTLTITVNPVNNAPIANAGIDILITAGATVELDGSQSIDTDGVIVSYQWTVLNGQELTIDNANSTMAGFIAPNVTSSTSYEFQLTVIDDQGATNTDTVEVIVEPVAIVGDSLNIHLAQQGIVVLRGKDQEGLTTTIILYIDGSTNVSWEYHEEVKDDNTGEITVGSSGPDLVGWDIVGDSLFTFQNALEIETNDGVFTEGREVTFNVNTEEQTLKVVSVDEQMDRYSTRVLASDLVGFSFLVSGATEDFIFDIISATQVHIQSIQTPDDDDIYNWKWENNFLIDTGDGNWGGEVYSDRFDIRVGELLVSEHLTVTGISVKAPLKTSVKDLNIADINFAQCVEEKINDNGYLAIEQITTLDCSNLNITDATGIEQLTALVNLNLSNNQLTEIDLSSNINITQLNLDDNQLTSIDFTNNSSLQVVTLLNNAFTQEALDYLAGIDWIEELTLDTTPIDTGEINTIFPDVNLASCVKGYVDTNNINDLNAIEELVCHRQGITDATGIEVLTQLKTLDFYGNELTSIDVSQNTLLTSLTLASNKLTDIDVSHNTALTFLELKFNKEISSLDVSNNTQLLTLSLTLNKLTTIDVSNNTLLVNLNVAYNQLTSIDVTNNTDLQILELSYDNQITSIDVTNNTELKVLTLHNNQISSIDISKLPLLEELHLAGNQLTSLDVSNNPNLTILRAWSNAITAIDTSNNPELTALSLAENQLTSVDFSNNSLLSYVSLTTNLFSQETIDYLNTIDWIETLLFDQTAAEPVISTGKLNDTGITTCSDASNNGIECPVTGFEGQDAEYGRDAQAAAGTLTKVGAGSGGFDFTKLDANGNALSASATEWSCVKDNHTGLVWEVKTDDGGLRDKDNTYSWYNSTGINDGGRAGIENGGSCPDTGSCDTEKYAASVNSVSLCGFNNWQMPTREELLSLIDYSTLEPSIDTGYFLNTKSSQYWSLSANAMYDDGYARIMDFSSGSANFHEKLRSNSVRLVKK